MGAGRSVSQTGGGAPRCVPAKKHRPPNVIIKASNFVPESNEGKEF